ncbi:hypothetical protein HanRHA438_Chr15g0705631 [Helianthus annuus]|uniref:Uncharacterized protein n=1 Tax=Helianthus annuus TaxID=4232 RepID=A0A9K3E071_HELAN|nr:hypothetical protein HanXRQr2_Chr15g0693301 [Helianthus annuus]KAJ0451200.1 hypothetical protein HanHA300_Chr15g0564891 [Helianthus annuus]KAJ0455643.1 hypothetical protein HanIR_Chr15g0753521 [Helianthus annuus]KAJ0473073.1 hypothetical protein HanHA89_Chr15g0614231 [Helianthus annuus]KAJ0648676.1 hypothetical protein HanLR1_Chr15g0575601 [Helianthus annuus]
MEAKQIARKIATQSDYIRLRPSSRDSNPSPTDVQCCMMYVVSPIGTQLM